MKKTYDFSITQQTSESLSLEIVDPAGNPRDLSGLDFKLDCRKTHNDSEALFSLGSSDSTIMLDTVNKHMIHLVFSHNLTKALSFDKGVYDLIAYLPDKSSVEKLMSGTVTLEKTITKLD